MISLKVFLPLSQTTWLMWPTAPSQNNNNNKLNVVVSGHPGHQLECDRDSTRILPEWPSNLRYFCLLPLWPWLHISLWLSDNIPKLHTLQPGTSFCFKLYFQQVHAPTIKDTMIQAVTQPRPRIESSLPFSYSSLLSLG